MAKSGRINLSVTSLGGYVTGWIDWAESDINVQNNTSVLTASLKYHNAYSGATYSNSSSFYLTVNGKTVNKTNGANLAPGSTVTVLTQTVTISHSSDGTKSVSISAGGALSGTSGLSASSGSGTAVLTAIARATTPTIPSGGVEIGKTTNIKLPRADSTYFHRLWWRMKGEGEDKWVQVGTTWTTSFDWPIPMDTCNKVTGAAVGYAELYCGTYTASDKLVGTRTVTVALNVPASVVPTIDSFVVSPANATEWVAQRNIYAQGYSKANAKTSASGVYGSTIKTIGVVVDNKGYFGANITTDVLPAGTLPVKVTVTDTRGRTATQTVSITVLPYSAPYIENLEYARGHYVDSAWTADDNGGDIRFTFTAGVSLAAQQNTVDVTISADGVFLQKQGETSGAKTYYLVGFGTDDTKAVTVEIVDKLGNSGKTEITITTVKVTVNIYGPLKRIGIGKVAEGEQIVDVALDVVHRVGTTPPGRESRIIQVDMMDYAGLGTEDNPTAYYQAWLRWVCAEYPGLTNVTFIGLTRPNFIYFTIATVYDTNDLQNGLPKYSGGVAFKAAQGGTVSFGTNNYVYGVS